MCARTQELGIIFSYIQNMQKCYIAWTMALWILEVIGHGTPGFLTRYFFSHGVTPSGPELVLPFPSIHLHPYPEGTGSAYGSRKWELLSRAVEK